MPSRLRRVARMSAVAAVAVAGSLTATAAATAAPALTVSTANGAGGSVVVSGTGFDQGYAPAPGTGQPGVKPGFYLAQGVVQGGTVTLATTSKWISAGNLPTSGRDALASDGSFTTTLPIATTVSTTGGVVDCKTTTCVVVAWPSQSAPAATGLIAQADLAFGPSLSVTPAGVTAPNAVTLAGTGFAQAYDSGHGVLPGFYIAQAALSGGVFTYNTAANKFINPANVTPTAMQDKLELDGSFSTSLATTATLDSGSIDCSAAGRCFFVAWPAQSAPTVANAIVLSSPVTVAPTATPDPGTGGGGGSSSPTLSASPVNGLSTTGPTTISVSGSGYDPVARSGEGIYVAFGPLGATAQSDFQASKWVHPGATPAAGQDVMSASGSFSTTLTVSPTFGATNCTLTPCYIQTFAAHGNPDRSQDKAILVSFGGTVASTDAPPAAGPLVPDAPTQAPSAVPGAGAGAAVFPKVTKLALGKKGRVSLTVSEPTTVTFTVRRKVGKRYVGVKTVKVTAKKAGKVSANLKISKKGLYRVTVQAKAANGLTKTVVKSVRIG
jgi:hypothetical protein